MADYPRCKHCCVCDCGKPYYEQMLRLAEELAILKYVYEDPYEPRPTCEGTHPISYNLMVPGCTECGMTLEDIVLAGGKASSK